AAGRGLVDDDDVFRVGLVAPLQITALLQTHSHGFEITGGDDVDECAALLGPVTAVFLGDQAPATIAVEGEHVGHARGFDAGKGADALQNFLQDGAAAGEVSAV